MDHNQTDIGRTAALSPTLDSNNDRLLTVNELSLVLKMHPGSIRRLASRGAIPALHVGRAIRFRIADVLRSMEGPVDE